MNTVSWGKQARYKFIANGALRAWSPEVTPAVFAITYKQDPQARPKAHTVLYFGQTEDLSKEGQAIHDCIQQAWLEHGGDLEDLFIFTLPMPGSTQRERADVQQQLVHEYAPAANY